VVADCFYGDNQAFVAELEAQRVGFVLAVKPQRSTWTAKPGTPSPTDAARALGWTDPQHPGGWRRGTRGHPGLPRRPHRDLVGGRRKVARGRLGTPPPAAAGGRHHRPRPPAIPARWGPAASWPIALRRVRSWLIPWRDLRRVWRAWSSSPPPRCCRP
jgi:hypothetical protein